MNNVTFKSPLSISDIEAIEKHCLEFSRYAKKVSNTFGIDWVDFDKKIRDSVRKLGIASLMFRKRIICVSGLQGAGKTTLMKNFYGIEDDRFFCPNISVGERIPILITEEDGLDKPYARAIMFNYGEDNEENKDASYEKDLEPEEIQSYLKGKYDNVRYVEFHLPCTRILNSATSFLLLPGYEKKSDYWNDLIDFSVNSSDAAVFVFSSDMYAQKFNQEYLERVKKKFGDNVIYVISRSDDSPDNNASFRENCLKELGIPDNQDDRIICVGAYDDESKNREWIDKFQAAIENHIVLDANPLDKNRDYLKKELITLKNEIMKVHKTISQQITFTDPNADEIERYLKEFDSKVKECKKELEENLKKEYGEAKRASIEMLNREFPGAIAGLRKKIFGVSAKDLIKRENLIMKCLSNGIIDGNNIANEDYFVGGTALGNSLCGYLTDHEKNLSKSPLPQEAIVSRDSVISLMECPLKVNLDNFEKAVDDVKTLLLPYNNTGDNDRFESSKYIQDIVGTVAELSVFYYCFNTYYSVAEKVQVKDFNPNQLAKVPGEFKLGDDILAEMSHCQKFVAGVAGVMGIDLLGDGDLSMAPTIANAIGAGAGAVPWIAAAIAAVVAAGAAKAVINDVNKIQREDLISCRNMIYDIYDQLSGKALDEYDNYIYKIRNRIEENLMKMYGVGKNEVLNLNIQIEVNNVTENIDRAIDKL